jgi:hypothetical protein
MQLAPSASRLLVQVGAHRHEGGHDPAPKLIKAGWSAILFEPQPASAQALREKYQGVSRVRVIQAALCTNSTEEFVKMWSLNTTRNLGSNESDVRCMGARLPSVIASLSRQHLLKHQVAYSPTICERCSRRLGRPLPKTCTRHVVDANLQWSRVQCSSVARELPAGRRSPDVLMIDAEGADDHLVRQYFKSGLEPPSQLVFEQTHLNKARRWQLAWFLNSTGMRLCNTTKNRNSMVPRGMNAEWVYPPHPYYLGGFGGCGDMGRRDPE